MTKFEELYNRMEQQDDLALLDSDSIKNPAKIIRDGEFYGIFLNESAYISEAARYCALAHECGHYNTGAVYTLYAPLITVEQCEAKAWRSSIYNELPLNEVVDAFESGCTNAWELSEHFEVTEDFIRRALEIYEHDLKRIYHERHGEDE